MTCPGVLVCVGREAFSPLLINFIRKTSEEKLPGLGPRTPGNGARSPATQGIRSPPHGAQSRASEYSEGHESKKNGEFFRQLGKLTTDKFEKVQEKEGIHFVKYCTFLFSFS